MIHLKPILAWTLASCLLACAAAAPAPEPDPFASAYLMDVTTKILDTGTDRPSELVIYSQANQIKILSARIGLSNRYGVTTYVYDDHGHLSLVRNESFNFNLEQIISDAAVNWQAIKPLRQDYRVSGNEISPINPIEVGDNLQLTAREVKQQSDYYLRCERLKSATVDVEAFIKNGDLTTPADSPDSHK